uniref:Serine/threonine-protein kinase ULK3 n=1 Tax=Strigamia maritima TaxID=126957 RepID=T1JMQ7_STRMM
MAAFPRIPGYIITEKVGSGSYATVYKAYRNDGKREVVAVKCVLISSLSKTSVENLLNEISLLKKLKHDNIVEMIDFQWDSEYIMIIMELSAFIRSRRSLPEKVVQFLRNQNICHMDLKPQNILLTSQHHDPVLKLADFGFAQYLKSDDDGTCLRGSPLYMAPEMLLKQKYDAKVDLWSVGVILYECLFGRAPYSSRTFTELAEKVKNPSPIEIPYGAQISRSCRDLLTKLLKRNPVERISFEDFFNHQFLDLEHTPSCRSYEKAAEIIADAVKKDEAQNYARAVELYCSGLQYLVAAIQYEQDSIRKTALRVKARNYMARAEYLKQMQFKRNKRKSSSSLTPCQELFLLSDDSQALHAALIVGESAEKLDQEDKYDEALNKYFLALDAMLPILQTELTGRRKELLNLQIRNWMERAEQIKYFQSLRIPEESIVINKKDGSTDNNCSIQ